MKEMQAIGKVL